MATLTLIILLSSLNMFLSCEASKIISKKQDLELALPSLKAIRLLSIAQGMIVALAQLEATTFFLALFTFVSALAAHETIFDIKHRPDFMPGNGLGVYEVIIILICVLKSLYGSQDIDNWSFNIGEFILFVIIPILVLIEDSRIKNIELPKLQKIVMIHKEATEMKPEVLKREQLTHELKHKNDLLTEKFEELEIIKKLDDILDKFFPKHIKQLLGDNLDNIKVEIENIFIDLINEIDSQRSQLMVEMHILEYKNKLSLERVDEMNNELEELTKELTKK